MAKNRKEGSSMCNLSLPRNVFPESTGSISGRWSRRRAGRGGGIIAIDLHGFITTYFGGKKPETGVTFLHARTHTHTHTLVPLK